MAEIGSLTASLKLESATFIRDLNKASQATARATTQMQRSFQNVGSVAKGALAAFATVATIRQLASVGRAAINAADDIGAAATAIGVSAEQLQRLRFAAEQSDVSIGSLDNALKLFQKNVATGKIESQSFESFIQKIREAPTQLDKVRIAQEGLGKQFQTGLLLAAANAEEFARQMRNANFISEKAVFTASQLDNSYREIQKAVAAGFSTGFLEAFYGRALNTDEALQKINSTAQTMGTVLSLAFQLATGAAQFYYEEIVKIANFDWGGLAAKIRAALPQPGMGSRIPGDGGDTSLFGASGSGEVGGTSVGLSAGIQGFVNLGNAAADATPKVEALNTAMNKGGTQAAAMGTVHQMTASQITMGWLSVAGVVGDALGTLFKDNKAVAIAQAVINTAQGITAALAQFPPPLSFAMAAAQAAAGAAQIAVIASTNPGSGKKSAAVTGGGGSRSAPARAGSSSKGSGGASSLNQAVTLVIQGESFGPAHFRKMVDGLNGVIRDGATLRIA
jgi:hypothetical protein